MSAASEPPPEGTDLEADIAACRAAAAATDGGVGPDGAALPAEQLGHMRAGLEAMLAREPRVRGWLWSLSRAGRAAVLSAVALAATAAVLLRLPRADLAVYPLAHMMATSGLLLVLLVVVSHGLLRPVYQPPASAGRLGVLLLLAVLLPAVWLAVPIEHVGRSPGQGWGFVSASLKCLIFGAVFGVPLMILARAARRAAVGGGLVAALAGIVGGLVGNLVLHVHCPITDLGHLLTGHALLLPLLLVVAAGPLVRAVARQTDR